MSRWLLLTAFSLACALAGCTPSIRPGLANVPRPPGNGPADEGVRDVVANGDDSCGARSGEGPLRYRWPPCTSAEQPIPDSDLLPATIGLRESLVVPWLEHFYVGFPCPHAPAKPDARARANRVTSVGWTPPPQQAKSCDVP